MAMATLRTSVALSQHMKECLGSDEMLLCLHRWFANPQRYGWYVLIRVARVGFGPFFNLAAVILVKRLVVGKFKAGKRDLSELGLLRHWLMGKLMPGGDLGKVSMSASCMFVP